MKKRLKEYFGYKVEASDGSLGMVHDFLFDDAQWAVRYLVVDTTGWWPGGRKVMLSPPAFSAVPEAAARHFQVRLTRSEIQEAPSVDPEKPVTREDEERMAAHYRWPAYWADLINAVTGAPEVRGPGYGLHRAKDILGFSVETVDGFVGHVTDMLVSLPDWQIRDLAIRAGGLIPRDMVWLEPAAIQTADWVNRGLMLNLHLRDVEGAPPGPPESPYQEGEGIPRQF